MSVAHLSLLGGFCLRDPAGRQVAIGSRKAQALLAVLGVAFPGSVGRERLIGILWGEHAQERARHSLRQAISELRRDAPSLIVVRGDALALDPAACTVDVATFQQFASADDAASLDRASQLYGGALVDGLVVREECFKDWSCALSDLRAQVRIGAEGVSAQQLDELVEWGDAHSAVGCTVRAGPKIDLEVEIV
jgi:DNA-binding SARP family transcriptional activator